MNVVLTLHAEYRIPDGQGIIWPHPQFVAEVTGIAGTRYGDRDIVALKVLDTEWLEILETIDACGGKNGKGRGALYGQRSYIVRLDSDTDIKSLCRHEQPIQLMMLRTQAVVGFAQLKQCAVVDQLALVIAPDNIGDASGSQPGQVSRQQSIEIRTGVRPRDPVLLHRREIHHRTSAADREIFCRDLVDDARNLVCVPRHPFFIHGVLDKAIVKRRTLQRLPKMVGGYAHLAAPISMTRFAAARPGRPVIPPPGWHPAPQR